MTDEKLKKLGEALIYSEHFEWLDGTKVLGGWHVSKELSFSSAHLASNVPDASNSATKGCLLELIRYRYHPMTTVELLAEDGVYKYMVLSPTDTDMMQIYAIEDTEAEALVAALIA